ncbi:MAG TPA: sugar phosphate isomerase/epimerase [Thermomicrobiales bacterium]|nr:sugar phosphate isomerase/epimerase [Thermomicrobiales bacterium]
MSERPKHLWRFGCQARPWLQTLGPERFRDELPDVMRQIADLGFAGFETALASLPVDDPGRFSRWRSAANGLELAAAHTGGAWWDPDKGASVPDLLLEVARLPELGCTHLMVSIGRGAAELDDQHLLKMVTILRTLGEGAAQYGVTMAIHNHDHELANHARILRALIASTSPAELMLGADIGWAMYGGWDPVAFVSEFGARLGYLHVRDVVQVDGKAGFTEVGRGTTDWPAFSEALRWAGYRGWLTAESEFSDHWRGLDDPAASAAAQYDGMRRAFAGQD